MAADYGAGELPQAFCRAAAVAGATYVLRAGVEALLLGKESQNCRGIKLKNGQVHLLEVGHCKASFRQKLTALLMYAHKLLPMWSVHFKHLPNYLGEVLCGTQASIQAAFESHGLLLCVMYCS